MDELRDSYDLLLNNIARELDISPSKYKVAVERYSAVGEWLENGNYGCEDLPNIYPQGSFALGTVVRPISKGEERDYDIDLVSELQILKDGRTPGFVKTVVGDRLKEHKVYQTVLDREGCRCWTLNYAEQDGIGFHLDVLPCLPDDDKTIAEILSTGVPAHLADKAIAITHREQPQFYIWRTSNPRGYIDWFNGVQRSAFENVALSQKQALLENNRAIYAMVEEVPDQLVRTPLQRAIQILKRHRDLRFAGHELEEAKPISMIITTLSAHLYNQEGDTYSTLKTIVEGIDAHASLLTPGGKASESIAWRNLITRPADGTWYIPNPVNPGENFADRWHDNSNAKARAFFEWAAWVRSDLVDILDQGNLSRIVESMQGRFGEPLVKKAAQGILAAPAFITSRIEPDRIGDKPSKPWGYSH